jgi:hypothetical protein
MGSFTFIFYQDGLGSQTLFHSELIIPEILILKKVGWTPWRGHQPVARPIPTQENINTEHT